MKPEKIIKLTRKQIYDEVWSISISGMVKKYDMPYSVLWKQIKDAEIPIPPAGYWTQKMFGKKTVTVELSGNPDEIIELHTSIRVSRAKDVSNEIKKDPKVIISQATIDVIEKVQEDKSQMTDSLSEPEVKEQWGQKYNVYRREVLYKEIWAFPITQVAKKYLVSDVAIHKVCKALEIPTPPKGYWAKVYAGKEVEIPHLPESRKDIKIGVRSEKTEENPQDAFSFMLNEEKEAILLAAVMLELPDDSEKLHSKLQGYKKKIGTAPADIDCSPSIKNEISYNSKLRKCRILDALIKAAEPLGVSLDNELVFHYKQDFVSLHFSEGTSTLPHKLTKEENMSLLKYEDERKRYSWASKPQIRKYDYFHTGRLSVKVGSNTWFRDNKTTTIEEQLGDIMIALFVAFQEAKVAREAREEAERKRQEEQRRAEERRKRYNIEVEKTLALENMSEDFETACKIRNLVKAVEEKGSSDTKVLQWISWAKAKADWYDPTVAADDEFFGTREHGKNKKDKTPEKAYFGFRF